MTRIAWLVSFLILLSVGAQAQPPAVVYQLEGQPDPGVPVSPDGYFAKQYDLCFFCRGLATMHGDYVKIAPGNRNRITAARAYVRNWGQAATPLWMTMKLYSRSGGVLTALAASSAYVPSVPVARGPKYKFQEIAFSFGPPVPVPENGELVYTIAIGTDSPSMGPYILIPGGDAQVNTAVWNGSVNLGMNRLVADTDGNVVNPSSLTASAGTNIYPALFYTDNSTGLNKWQQPGQLREDTTQAVNEPLEVKGISPIVTFYAVR